MDIRIIIIISMILLSSCSLKPERINSGTNALNILNFDIKEGITKRSDIIELLGPPSINNPFNKSVDYYVSQQMIKKVGEQDQIQKIIILELQYDNNQLVENFNLTKKDNVDSFDLNDLEDSRGFDDRKGFNILKTLMDNMRRKTRID